MKDIFEVKQASKFDESFPHKTFLGRDKNEPAQRLAMPMILLSDFWSNKTEKMITMIDHVLQILFFLCGIKSSYWMEKQTMHYSECKFRHRYIILPGKEKHFKKLIERKEKQFIPDDVSYFNDLFLNPSKLKKNC